MTFARAYVNQENPHTYMRMFTEVFRLIGELCQNQVKWKYLHGSGFESMIMDMDSHQLTGNILEMHLKYITNFLRVWLLPTES